MQKSLRYWFNLLMTFLLALLAGLAVIVIDLSRRQAYALVHPRRSYPATTPAIYGLPYEEVSFKSTDGLTLQGWFIPPEGERPVIILCHGSGANREMMLPYASVLARHGYGALLFDFRAHGESEGEVMTYGLKEADDIVGAAAFLKARGVERIGVWGISLGGAAAILAAAHSQQIGAVVAESAFADLETLMGHSFSLWTGFPSFPFAPITTFFAQRELGIPLTAVNPAREIGRISPRAVLLIHGSEDPIIPLEHAYRLYQAAGEPKELWVVKSTGHGGFIALKSAELEARVTGFFQKHLRPEE